MNHIRLKNGNTVYIPETMKESEAAMLLARSGAQAGQVVTLSGQQRQYIIRGGIPTFVRYIPNPVVML